ncbi:uncharacterized protein PFL1_03205 [Pseudozyma flocculosa PF-1]|uniref:Uncharacterized protein n=2 Tax=Pseudozyma flocculosa TaxID=84751 RepID=A0A5C3F1T6_9BASI|nr:uncharacterized protein PFL1_03205 [Pseudozyma flocculosa PF-1]EPQ29450.1 hypothetical protein PFL1_03205 [Pseudozyma flocculosa PF-1]SPO37975.1 uncharacterized protein PSFLO_03452 [Pseudozyma flocculosa]
MPTLEGKKAAWFSSAACREHRERILDDVYDVDHGLVTRLDIAGVRGQRAVLHLSPHVFPNGADILVATDDDADFASAFRTKEHPADPRCQHRQTWAVTTRECKFGAADHVFVFVEALPGTTDEVVSVTKWMIVARLVALDKEIWAEIGEDFEVPAADMTTKLQLPPEMQRGYAARPPFSSLARPIQTFGEPWTRPSDELEQVCERLRMLGIAPVNLPPIDEPMDEPMDGQPIAPRAPAQVKRRRAGAASLHVRDGSRQGQLLKRRQRPKPSAKAKVKDKASKLTSGRGREAKGARGDRDDDDSGVDEDNGMSIDGNRQEAPTASRGREIEVQEEEYPTDDDDDDEWLEEVQIPEHRNPVLEHYLEMNRRLSPRLLAKSAKGRRVLVEISLTRLGDVPSPRPLPREDELAWYGLRRLLGFTSDRVLLHSYRTKPLLKEAQDQNKRVKGEKARLSPVASSRRRRFVIDDDDDDDDDDDGEDDEDEDEDEDGGALARAGYIRRARESVVLINPGRYPLEDIAKALRDIERERTPIEATVSIGRSTRANVVAPAPSDPPAAPRRRERLVRGGM